MATALRDLRMTVDEFLSWDDGTDTRYELENGYVVAMAPARPTHGVLAQNVGDTINRLVVSRPPCRAIQAAGLTISASASKFYIPAVLMTCEPPGDTTEVQEPQLVVEILSPSTKGIDQKRKVPAYARLPTVQEIWLVASDERWALVWKRTGDGWVAELPYVGDATFASPILRGCVTLEEVYRLTRG